MGVLNSLGLIMPREPWRRWLYQSTWPAVAYSTDGVATIGYRGCMYHQAMKALASQRFTSDTSVRPWIGLLLLLLVTAVVVSAVLVGFMVDTPPDVD